MTCLVRLTMGALVVGILAPGAAGQDAEADRLAQDCGVNSLYVLLQLRDATPDLAQLRAGLPDTRANGLSMAGIQAASGRHGVPLRGRWVGPGDVPIDRPMIALLRPEGASGHFVVIEPVGVLGKSVLVLDFPRPPQIMAYADLIGSAAWTGLTLAPVTAPERFGPWAAAAVGVALVGWGLAARRTRRPGVVGPA